MARVEVGACRQLDNRISCSTITMKNVGIFVGTLDQNGGKSWAVPIFLF